jgi:GNAT superfamily N-acetyltransferase
MADLIVGQNRMIRLATSTDITGIARLNHAVQRLHAEKARSHFRLSSSDTSFIDWFKKASAEPTAYVLLAEESGDTVGYLYADEVQREKTWVRPAMRFFMLHHIAVAPAFQKRGVGGGLMQAFIAEARRRRIGRIELDVWSFNEKAQRFFARHGLSVFNCRMEALLRNLPNQPPLPTPGKCPPSNHDQLPGAADL